MADLEGKTIAATYRSVLNVGTANNQKLDTTPRVIADGAGNASALYLATDEVLINGSYQLTFNATGSGEYIYGDGTDLRVYSGADILLVPTGNVGIGTTTPTADGLSVTGAPGYDESGILQITTGSGAATDSKLVFGVVDTDYAYIQSIKPEDNRYDLALNPAGGNVGIGTASPATLLHVEDSSGTAASPTLKLSGASGATSNQEIGRILFHKHGASVTSYIKCFNTATHGSNLGFGVVASDAAASADAMTIIQNGNVGIGVTPSSVLGIKGGADSGIRLYQSDGTTATATIEATGSNNARIQLYNSDEQVNIDFAAISGGDSYFRDSNLGIGTASPAYRLQVTDNPGDNGYVASIENSRSTIDDSDNILGLKFTGDTDGDSREGNFIIFADYNTGEMGVIKASDDAIVVDQYSDYRLKENILTLGGGLEKVNQLRPVTFNYKTQGNKDNLHEGFIAHEVQEHIPYAVRGEKDAVRDDGSIKKQTFCMYQLIPRLVLAIQELSAKVEALENA